MPKRIRFEGRVYVVPDDATDDEIASLIDSDASPAAASAEAAPEASGPSLASRAASGVGRFVGNAADNAGLNPIGLIRGLYSTITSPVETAKSIVAPLGRLPGAARELAAGNFTKGLNEAAASIPIIGPMGERASAKSKAGDWAGAAGDVVGMVAAPFVPGAAGTVGRAAAATRPARALGPTRIAGRVLGTTDDAAARAVLDEGLLSTGIKGGQRAVERRLSQANAEAVAATQRGLGALTQRHKKSPKPEIDVAAIPHSRPVRDAYTKNRDPKGAGAQVIGGEMRAVLDSPTMTATALDDALQQADAMRRGSLTSTGAQSDAHAAIAKAIRDQVSDWLPHPRQALATIDRFDPIQRTLHGAKAAPAGAPPIASGFLGSTLPYLVKRGTAPVAQAYDYTAKGATSAPMRALIKAAFLEQLAAEEGR